MVFINKTYLFSENYISHEILPDMGISWEELKLIMRYWIKSDGREAPLRVMMNDFYKAFLLYLQCSSLIAKKFGRFVWLKIWQAATVRVESLKKTILELLELED